MVHFCLLHWNHLTRVLRPEPAEPLRAAGVDHGVLSELDQHQVLQLGQVLFVGGILDIPLIVDVCQPERLLSVDVFC